MPFQSVLVVQFVLRLSRRCRRPRRRLHLLAGPTVVRSRLRCCPAYRPWRSRLNVGSRRVQFGSHLAARRRVHIAAASVAAVAFNVAAVLCPACHSLRRACSVRRSGLVMCRLRTRCRRWAVVGMRTLGTLHHTTFCCRHRRGWLMIADVGAPLRRRRSGPTRLSAPTRARRLRKRLLLSKRG